MDARIVALVVAVLVAEACGAHQLRARGTDVYLPVANPQSRRGTAGVPPHKWYETIMRLDSPHFGKRSSVSDYSLMVPDDKDIGPGSDNRREEGKNLPLMVADDDGVGRGRERLGENGFRVNIGGRKCVCW